MKKCLIFFTLLLMTIALAVFMQYNDHLSNMDDTALTDAPSNDLLAQDQIAAMD